MPQGSGNRHVATAPPPDAAPAVSPAPAASGATSGSADAGSASDAGNAPSTPAGPAASAPGSTSLDQSSAGSASDHSTAASARPAPGSVSLDQVAAGSTRDRAVVTAPVQTTADIAGAEGNRAANLGRTDLSGAEGVRGANFARGGADTTVKDLRIRLSPIQTAFTQVLGRSGVLAPLHKTRGLLFPYTPQISITQDVSYQDVSLVHTNGDFLAYQKTPSVSISLSGKFTVQTQAEGIYALACLHFLRVASKMYFGASDLHRGLPPPILELNGYGTYMFNQLRVVLKAHSYTFPEQMDTVLVTTAGGTARLPALFDLSVTLVVQQTPRAMRADFNLEQFRTGALMVKGGWI